MQRVFTCSPIEVKGKGIGAISLNRSFSEVNGTLEEIEPAKEDGLYRIRVRSRRPGKSGQTALRSFAVNDDQAPWGIVKDFLNGGITVTVSNLIITR